MGSSTQSRFRSWLAGATLLLGSRLALAQSELDIALDYRESMPCPDEAWFVHQVQARSERVRFADGNQEPAMHLVVALDSQVPEGWLELRRPESEPLVRRVSGASCEEVVDALASLVVEAVDPALPPAPTPEPESRRAVAPASGDAAAAPPAAAPAVAQAELASSSESDGSATLTWRPHLGLGASVASGMGPYPSFGATTFVRAGGIPQETLTPALVVSAEYTQSRTVDAEVGSAAFTRALGRIQGCTVAAALGRGAVALPCLAFEAARLSATGENSAGQTGRNATAWFAFGLGVRLEWPPSRRTLMSFDGLVARTLARPEFYLGDSSARVGLYQVPAWAVGGSLGVAAALF